MTNYNAWDAKTKALTEEAEADDKQQQAESNKALGLDGPQGPPVAQHKAQQKELDEHSQKRKEFIEWNNSREVTLTHDGSSGSTEVELSSDTVQGKGIRLLNSRGVRYTIPADAGMAKLMLDKCGSVQVVVGGSLMTSTMEICRCVDLQVELDHPLGTLQVDECSAPVHVRFADREHVGAIYHQNSPGLSISWPGASEVAGKEQIRLGVADAVQYCTRLADPSLNHALITAPVQRGEGEFPIDVPSLNGDGGHLKVDPSAPSQEPVGQAEGEQWRAQAQQKRQQGNEMFRANDFMQAALSYTQALDLDPSDAAVWANRAQCWLKLGDHAKAFDDATKCTELDSANPKGWFRKGMSLHAQQRYAEAIPALLEAEKLDPKNKQIPEAVKYAQLMARKQATAGS